MIEFHTFRGREVRVELIEVVDRQFRWTWTIDGEHVARSPQTLMAEEVARSEALLYAQLRIARLEDCLPARVTDAARSRRRAAA